MIGGGKSGDKNSPYACSKLRKAEKVERFSRPRHTGVGMITLLFALVSLLSFRVRSRASLELELVTLRHQVIVLRRQRPGQLRLLSPDRLLWVWLYRASMSMRLSRNDIRMAERSSLRSARCAAPRSASSA